MKISPILAILLALISLSLPACHPHKEEETHHEQQKIVVTSPEAKDVVITQQYVAQIRSQRQIDVNAMVSGKLLEVPIKEGQLVKEGELMFKILPTLYQAKLAAEEAEVQLAQQELNNNKQLYDKQQISINELLLYEAKLAKAKAKANEAAAELKFTSVTAPFDGIVDRLLKQQGSVINEKEILTTLSDNSTMWVYFNVPECRYLEYMASQGKDIENRQIELVLANGSKFPQPCKLVTPMGKVNNETGNISFRADFPNPDRLLRHGQTGNVLVRRTLKNAIVIPQRATFEILDKQYVYVVGPDHKAHQREIIVQNELEDVFVLKSGVGADERIVFEGVRQVHEGDKIEYEFREPEKIFAHQKFRAE